MERDEPVFTQGSNQVSMTVYFPYKGDPSLFRLYYGSRPLSPPPPSFEVGDGVLIKTYVLEKQRLKTWIAKSMPRSGPLRSIRSN